MLLAAVLLAVTNGHAVAATYYVDSRGGNDARDGLTTATAWQTVAKVNQGPPSASYRFGDTVLFRRGGAWNEKLDLSKMPFADYAFQIFNSWPPATDLGSYFNASQNYKVYSNREAAVLESSAAMPLPGADAYLQKAFPAPRKIFTFQTEVQSGLNAAGDQFYQRALDTAGNVVAEALLTFGDMTQADAYATVKFWTNANPAGHTTTIKVKQGTKLPISDLSVYLNPQTHKANYFIGHDNNYNDGIRPVENENLAPQELDYTGDVSGAEVRLKKGTGPVARLYLFGFWLSENGYAQIGDSIALNMHYAVARQNFTGPAKYLSIPLVGASFGGRMLWYEDATMPDWALADPLREHWKKLTYQRGYRRVIVGNIGSGDFQGGNAGFQKKIKDAFSRVLADLYAQHLDHVIVIAIAPRGNASGMTLRDAPTQAAVAGVNAYLQTLCAQYGFDYYDGHAVLAAPGTDYYAPGMSTDNIHPNTEKAFRAYAGGLQNLIGASAIPGKARLEGLDPITLGAYGAPTDPKPVLAADEDLAPVAPYASSPFPVIDEGFESASLPGWTRYDSLGRASVDSAEKHSGASSIKFVYSDAIPESVAKTFSPLNEFNLSFWVKFDLSAGTAQPATPTGMARATVSKTGVPEDYCLYYKKVGSAIQLLSQCRLNTGYDTMPYTLLTADSNWHKIEVQVKFDPTAGSHRVLLDGALKYDHAGLANNTHGPVSFFQIGNYGNVAAGNSGVYWADDLRLGVSCEVPGGTWYASCPVAPKRVWVSGEEGASSVATPTAVGPGKWYYDSVAGKVYVYSAAGTPSIHVSTVREAAAVIDKKLAVLDHLDLRGGTATVKLLRADGARFLSCDLGLNSVGSAIGASLSDGGLAQDCTVSMGTPKAMATQNGIGLRDGCNGWLIQGCAIQGWEGYGVSIRDTNPAFTSANNRLTGNSFSYQTGGAVLVEGPAGLASRNFIEQNIIAGASGPSALLNADQTVFRFNIVESSGGAQAILIGGPGSDLAGKISPQNMWIYNNTLTGGPSASNLSQEGIRLMATGAAFPPVQGNRIYNNLLYNTGRNSVPANLALRIDDAPSVLAGEFRNNLAWSASAPDGRVIYNGHDPLKAYVKSLAEFNAMTGTAGDTIAGNLYADPQFYDYEAGNLQFPASSPCVDASFPVTLPFPDPNPPPPPLGQGMDIGALDCH